MALTIEQYSLILILGALVGVLFGIRRIYTLEYKIERLEEHMEKILSHIKKR